MSNINESKSLHKPISSRPLTHSSSLAVDATLRGEQTQPRFNSISVEDPTPKNFPRPPRPAVINGGSNTSPKQPQHHGVRGRGLPPTPSSDQLAGERPPEVPSRNHASAHQVCSGPTPHQSGHTVPPPRHAGRRLSDDHPAGRSVRSPTSPPAMASSTSPVPPPGHPSRSFNPSSSQTSLSSTSSSSSRPPLPKRPGRERPPVSPVRGMEGPPRPLPPPGRPAGSSQASRNRPPVVSRTPSKPSLPENARIVEHLSQIDQEAYRLLDLINSGDPALHLIEAFAGNVQEAIEEVQGLPNHGGGLQFTLCLANLRGIVGALRDANTQSDRNKLNETIKSALSKTKQLSGYL